MKRHAAVLGAVLSIPLASLAQPWEFAEPIDITTLSDQSVFHHLESAGRRSIAVSGERVALTWEDDRDGTPRVYLAYKDPADARFSPPRRLSGDGEAYEPAIAALPGNRFAVAWVEDGAVRMAIVPTADATSAANPITLSSAGGQVSLTTAGETILAAWSDRRDRFGRIRLARVTPAATGEPSIATDCPADAEPPVDEQLYPALAVSGGNLVVAWEDRRPGHTIILAATAPRAEPCRLTPPVRISAAIEQRSAEFGKGHGVSRVALGAHGEAGVLAAWADKRNFQEGYDIFAADYAPTNGFGGNIRVQDDFGGVARQWHATVAGHPDGTLVTGWTDEREGHADVMLSWREDGAWSEDLPVPGASGPGWQNHPSITLDTDGNLHLAWVEREIRDGSTRLRYVLGTKSVD